MGSMRVWWSIVVVWMGSLAVAGPVEAPGAPPETRREPVVEEIHGVEIMDPYRWLEGDNSDPESMGAMTQTVAEWTDAQNAYTRRVLDNLPGRERLESRLRELMEVGSISAPGMAGNRYFYTEREGDQAQAIVYVRSGHAGEPRALIDPNTLDDEGLYTVSWFSPSHDGKHLAFGMYYAGDENSTLYVLDVDSGTWLADEIPGKTSFGGWMPDGRGFFYRNLADVGNAYSGQILYHELGTHHRQDPVLIDQRKLSELYAGAGYSDERLEQLETTYGPFASPSRDGRWLTVGYWTGTRDNDLWVADLDRWFRTGELVKTPIVVGEGAQSFGEILGDTMYLNTNLDAPTGRIVAIDLHNPGVDNWTTVVPEQPGAVLQGFGLARGMLAANYLENAASRIQLYTLEGSRLEALDLPNIGTASLATEPDRTEAFLSFESWNMPESIYRVDLASGARELWERPDVPVDPASITVEQAWYTSRDGTRVSMFLVHKKGLELDGTNPTILYGYGGFNISLTPFFSATMYPWYEQGGVYAVANLRGGGEYGKQWHEAGRLDRKQNVFDDFIAAAQWLIDQGYTSPEHLGIWGGSNGGLLTGAAVTQRPELFSAAISAVPLLDMIRYQDFLMARYWIPEYGSAENSEQFRTILDYSPYHNVRKGVEYPAVLFTAGENDARVHPMHARKMAARMQAATASDPSTEPILLWVERKSGHGGGKPLWMRVRDAADTRIFMMWQLGMLDEQDG